MIKTPTKMPQVKVETKMRKKRHQKEPWTEEEDNLIRMLVKTHGPKKWRFIASFVGSRRNKQCRERWYNHLNPQNNTQEWSNHEQWIVFLAQRVYGNKWAEMTKFLPGRSDNSIKNHWNSRMRRRISEFQSLLNEFTSGRQTTHFFGQNQQFYSRVERRLRGKLLRLGQEEGVKQEEDLRTEHPSCEKEEKVASQLETRMPNVNGVTDDLFNQGSVPSSGDPAETTVKEMPLFSFPQCFQILQPTGMYLFVNQYPSDLMQSMFHGFTVSENCLFPCVYPSLLSGVNSSQTAPRQKYWHPRPSTIR